MSEFQDQLGFNQVVSEGINPKPIQQSAIVQVNKQNIDGLKAIPQSEPINTNLKIKPQYQFSKNNNNFNQIQIPEVKNCLDENTYFFTVLIQLCNDIELLKYKYKIHHMQILDDKKEEIGIIKLNIEQKQQVINAYKQSNTNIKLEILKKLTLNALTLDQLMGLHFVQIFELEEMKIHIIQKEVTFNFWIDLY